MSGSTPHSTAEVRTLCSVMGLPPTGGVFNCDSILLGCLPTRQSKAIKAAYRRDCGMRRRALLDD